MQNSSSAAPNRLGDALPTTASLTAGLGWLSIGLGLAELAFSRTIARALGLGRRDDLVRLYGLREIGAGVGILASGDPEPFIWGRVLGDLLDLATVERGLRTRRKNTALATMLLLGGVTVVDAACGAKLAARRTAT